MRKCKKCGLEKDIKLYPVAGTIKGITYYRHICCPCYTEHKKPRQVELREWFVNLKKGLSCERCGNSDHRVLDFDHIDPKDKICEVAECMRRGQSKDKVLKEIEKCRVLCANCHRIKTYEERL